MYEMTLFVHCLLVDEAISPSISLCVSLEGFQTTRYIDIGMILF